MIDALTAGLNQAARRPFLFILPAILDIALWLAPRLSVEQFLARALTAWEAIFRAVYTPTQMAAMGDMLTLARELVGEVGTELNLAAVAVGGWLAPPSALTAPQASRLVLISDGVLAPLGFSLRLPNVAPFDAGAVVEINSGWAVAAIVVGLWLAGQALTAVYLRWIAASHLAEVQAVAPKAAEPPAMPVLPALWPLTIRFVALSLVLGAFVLALRLPLAVVASLAMVTGGAGGGFLFALSGGLTLWLTLWFLLSFFFVGEVLLLDGQSLWRSLWRGLILVRRNSFRVLGFVTLANVVLLGFRAIWGFVGQTPVGALGAIVGNAYLATGMVLAAFSYYRTLRQQPG